MSSPVIDTSRSPHARLKSVSISQVQLTDSFWAPRLETNRSVTIPSQYEHCESTGRIDNFRRASGRKQGEFQGIFFNDSDVYKWLEAACFCLAAHRDAELEQVVDGVIEEIAAAQEADGYLNTYYTFERTSERWTNLRDMHELYCAGHLIQGAAAHHRATGKETLLKVASRLADHICATFGPGLRDGTPGHEEIEMALVELYRETGEVRYLHEAGFFIDRRGAKPPVIGGSAYHQDHEPFRELDGMVGHAVRALYLNSGATDVYAETGEEGLHTALKRHWENMTERRMYITGGLGARYEGEAFGGDYELPNDRAYTETCAAIGSIFWNWRMLSLNGDARYADLMETTLYNAMLSGISLDGKSYFYQNPLVDEGRHRRQPWFGCACCPPNVARMLASLPGYFYSMTPDAVWVHLYASGRADFTLPREELFGITQDTDYPWSGNIRLEIISAPDKEITLFLRIPAWCTEARIEVDGKPLEWGSSPGGYVAITQKWSPGTLVELTLSMPVRLVKSHPYLTSNRGQVAICRGPLVYCLEGVDHPGMDLRDIRLPVNLQFSTEFRPDLLNGVVTLQGEGLALDGSPSGSSLYSTMVNRPAMENGAERSKPAHLTAVPYYAWANREPGRMRVWIPLDVPGLDMI